MERARELDPSSSSNHMVSAQIAYQSRDFAAAERHARQSIAIDPNFWAGHFQRAQALAAQHRLDEALAEANESYRLAQNAKGFLWRGYVLALMGQRAEAQKLLREFEQRTPLVAPYEIAVVNAGLNDANGVFAALQTAYEVRDVNLVFLPVHPIWDPFKADARFQALLDRCGFLRQR
jgi:tetratricopeptide (TPR) repeat protein